MPEVVDWQRCQPSEVLPRAVDLLRGGRFVAFPTDTNYVVAALADDAEAVARLERPGVSLTLAVTGLADLEAWVPGLSNLGRRLTRSAWPGPVALLCGPPLDPNRTSSLPERVCRILERDGAVAFRSPGHNAIHQALGLLCCPLVVAEAGNTAAEATKEWGEEVALVIDDGPTYFQQKATVVRVEGGNWKVVSEGALPAAGVAQLAPCRILFICTGNTCRSPLAQGLCAKLLADRLGCLEKELPERGFIVQSAGLAAMIGGEAAATEMGADLSGHRSRPLTLDLLVQADFLFAMTRSHLHALSALEGRGGPVPRLLSVRGEDIPDPIGASAEVYRDCAKAIRGHLEDWLPELLQP